MPGFTRLLIAAIGLLLFAFVLDRIRRRRMRIEYSVAWFVMALGVLLLALLPDVFDALARALGIDYPPALYFLGAILVLFLILLHVSAELTRMRAQNKTLVQEMSLLRARLDRAGIDAPKHDTSSESGENDGPDLA